MSEAVRGRYILVGDREGTVIEDGAVVFDDSTIVDIGPSDEMQRVYQPQKIHGSSNHVVLPGLVNAHQHGNGINLMRVGCMDGPLERFIIERQLHPDAGTASILYENTLLVGLKMLRSGMTTVLHHFSELEANSENYLQSITLCLQAYSDLGMRVAFAPSIRDVHQFAYVDDDIFISSLPAPVVDSLRELGIIPVQYPTATQYFEAFDKLRNKHENGKTRFLFGPSGPQWCSQGLLEKMSERSRKERIGIHIHVLESPIQRKYGDREYHGGMIDYLEGLGLLNKQLTIAHGTMLISEEIKKLANAGCSLAHNPSSNLRLFNGVAAVREMLEEGLQIGIGTDNLSLDNDEDIFREMRLCSALQRPLEIDVNEIPGSVLLNMNVDNGAKITQFEDAIGPLAKGKRADLVLLNFKEIEGPFISRDTDLVTVILGDASIRHVDTVFIDGVPVLEQGKPKGVNEGHLLRDIKQKFQLIGENTEDRKIRLAITHEMARLYTKW